MEETIIPIDENIAMFSAYLANNPRAILSARFGDGKTFFLEEFKERLTDMYLFLTLYPVNYQVAENKDVFEYIKRDIILQLLMSTEMTLSENEKKFSFLSQIEGFLNVHLYEFLIDSVKMLAGAFGVIPQEAMQMLSKNIAKFKEFSDKTSLSESDVVENYIKSFAEQTGDIYEFDPISKLIRQLIIEVKEKTHKEVVLIIEDMDRIDPAHLFRILNIFSAHWDIMDCSEDKLRLVHNSNKYAIDKILLVCHYENIKNIFHHFYGAQTDFNGYIQKFCTTQPFEYSLRNLVKEWITQHIVSEFAHYTDVRDTLAEIIVQKYLGDNSNTDNNIKAINLRKITSFFTNIRYRIRKDNIEFVNSNYFISSDNQLTRLISILREFDISINEFLTYYVEKYSNNTSEIVSFIDVCWLILPHILPKDEDSIHFENYSPFGSIVVVNINGLSTKIHCEIDDTAPKNGQLFPRYQITKLGTLPSNILYFDKFFYSRKQVALVMNYFSQRYIY